jgi:hypothetical protein
MGRTMEIRNSDLTWVFQSKSHMESFCKMWISRLACNHKYMLVTSKINFTTIIHLQQELNRKIWRKCSYTLGMHCSQMYNHSSPYSRRLAMKDRLVSAAHRTKPSLLGGHVVLRVVSALVRRGQSSALAAGVPIKRVWFNSEAAESRQGEGEPEAVQGRETNQDEWAAVQGFACHPIFVVYCRGSRGAWGGDTGARVEEAVSPLSSCAADAPSGDEDGRHTSCTCTASSLISLDRHRRCSTSLADYCQDRIHLRNLYRFIPGC